MFMDGILSGTCTEPLLSTFMNGFPQSMMYFQVNPDCSRVKSWGHSINLVCAPQTCIFHFHLLTSPLSFPSYQVKELELEGHLEWSTKSLACVNLPSLTINISRNKTFYNSSGDVVKSFQCS